MTSIIGGIALIGSVFLGFFMTLMVEDIYETIVSEKDD